MSRLTPLDKALVLILVPIWVTCFALGLRSVVRGGAITFLGLSVEGSDRYPIVSGDFQRALSGTDLRVGDRLIRVGDADLRGVGTPGFVGYSHEEAGRDLSVPLVFERDGERFETSLPMLSVSIFLRPFLAASFALAASGLFLLLRGRPTPTVRAYFYFAMCWALVTCAFYGSRLEVYATFTMFAAGNCVFFPLAFRFAFLFPDDRAPDGRWHRIWPWFFAVLGPFLGMSFLRGTAIWQIPFYVTFALGGLAMLAVTTRKYRGADRVARRQMKWVLLGIYCAALPQVVGATVSVLSPRFGWIWFASFWALPLLPLSLVISVARYNLFDIDRVLSAAASYNILVVLLGAGALVGVPRLAEAASGFVGIASA